MTGTDLCVNKPQSVPVIFEPPCIKSYKIWTEEKVRNITDIQYGKKVKFDLEQATNTQRGSKCIALLCL